jgi:hypothetical protein
VPLEEVQDCPQALDVASQGVEAVAHSSKIAQDGRRQVSARSERSCDGVRVTVQAVGLVDASDVGGRFSLGSGYASLTSTGDILVFAAKQVVRKGVSEVVHAKDELGEA